VTVQNMSFDSDPVVAELPAPNWMDQGRRMAVDYSFLLRPISLLGLFMLAYSFIVRPIQKQVMSAPPAQLTAAPAPASLPTGAGTNRIGGGSTDRDEITQAAAKLKEQMVGVIKESPVNSTRAVQAWLREEPS